MTDAEGQSDPYVAFVTDIADMENPPLVNSISWGSIEQVKCPSLSFR